ncbi:tyrosine-type recombinase/integrase [Endozoicomonas atrinae]|uniref:tyrosine-type recombinase/integrase n=1 Tax=Endozoicomonas atrinae TaxID=1333660 RepID=UPI000826EED7|nr:tyrosine-type recombinase/integrase [Endozoicomonas atrinae]
MPGMHSCGKNLLLSVGKKRSTWYGRVFIDGKRKDVKVGDYKFLTLSEARARLSAIQDSLAVSGTFEVIETFGEAYELLKEKGVSESYDSAYRTYLETDFGPMKLDAIQPIVIERKLNQIRKAGIKTTGKKVLSVIQRVYKLANRLRLTEKNPSFGFESKDASTHISKNTRTLSMDELEAVFEHFRNQRLYNRRNYLMLAVKTALTLRVRELVAMKMSDVDLNKGCWRTPDFLRNTKKWIHELIPLEPEVVGWIKEANEFYPDSDYVFAVDDGGVCPNTLRNWVEYQYKKGKLNHIKVWAPHSLRRTGRTFMSKNKISYEVAEACLGHRKKGVDDVYNTDDHFEERRAAQRIYLDTIAPFINA